MLRSFILGLVLSVSTVLVGAPKEYKLDTAKSVIKWTGSKGALGKVVGQHNGTVTLSNGTVAIENNVPKTGTFTINLTTIKDVDITDAENRGKLEAHLKSADFFDVAKYPTGTFTITTVKPGHAPQTVDITGNLMLKNITKPVTFPATVAVTGTTATAKGELTINRVDWDVKYNSKKFFDVKKLGDKIIHDDIKLELDLVATESTPSIKKASR